MKDKNLQNACPLLKEAESQAFVHGRAVICSFGEQYVVAYYLTIGRILVPSLKK
jgi:hypothetical protein